jgi:hypothetical protein
MLHGAPLDAGSLSPNSCPSKGVNLYLVLNQDMDRKFFTANEVWCQEAPFSPLLEGEGPSSLLDFGVLNVVHMVVSMFSISSQCVLRVVLNCTSLYANSFA